MAYLNQDHRIAAGVIVAFIAWFAAGAGFGFDPGQALFNLLAGGLFVAMLVATLVWLFPIVITVLTRLLGR